jgi:hypothetical protein
MTAPRLSAARGAVIAASSYNGAAFPNIPLIPKTKREADLELCCVAHFPVPCPLFITYLGLRDHAPSLCRYWRGDRRLQLQRRCFSKKKTFSKKNQGAPPAAAPLDAATKELTEARLGACSDV